MAALDPKPRSKWRPMYFVLHEDQREYLERLAEFEPSLSPTTVLARIIAKDMGTPTPSTTGRRPRNYRRENDKVLAEILATTAKAMATPPVRATAPVRASKVPSTGGRSLVTFDIPTRTGKSVGLAAMATPPVRASNAPLTTGRSRRRSTSAST
jgi:hypothetical protein